MSGDEEVMKYLKPIRWTDSGVECWKIEANCEKCPIAKIMNWTKDTPRPGTTMKCYQHLSNLKLIANGVPFPTEKRINIKMNRKLNLLKLKG